MFIPRFLPAALAAASLALAAAPAAAQATKAAKERSFGKGKATGVLLTRNELRACLQQQDSLKAKREETLQLQAKLANDKEDIEKRGNDLKDQLVWLDRTSQEQVDKYNAQATERDKLIDDYQARTTAFNAQVDALNADRDTWGRNCENRRYDENEELLIRAGK
jgi:hypothetical protein